MPNSHLSNIAHRASWLTLLVVIGASFVGWRLFQKSVLEHSVYAARAANQYEVSEVLIPRRGLILAQDGELNRPVVIASSEELFNISVVPRNIKDKALAAQTLATVFDLDEEEIYSKINNDRLYVPPIVRGANKAKRDEIVAQGFVGLLIEREYRRTYPEGYTAAQMLGFVNHEGQGSYGIEGYYNNLLLGKPGKVLGEKDTLGRVVLTKERIEPQHGASIELTIDHNVQFAIEKRLEQTVQDRGAESGQVVLMNPNNGEIIAMASSPTFDPNRFNEYAAETGSLEIFQNPVVNTVYEVGSIMKPIVMAMAIDYGRLTKDTVNTFGSSTIVGPHRISNATGRSFGRSTMADVVRNSDNVGMIWTASHMTYEEMYDGFARFGLADLTGIDLPGEVRGFLLNHKNWRAINRATMSFGQGISSSPIQIVRAWAAMINGGNLVTPHIVKSMSDEKGKMQPVKHNIESGVISEETSKVMREIGEYTAQHGFYNNIYMDSHRVGAKTGTAQIAGPHGGYLSDAYTHSVMSFFPAEDPQFVMLVKLDKPKHGNFAESTTGPLVKDITQFLVNYYKIAPDRN